MSSPLHRWWLWGCFAATLLASWAGGFGVSVTAVFIGIYLTGLVLIGRDEPGTDADPAAGADAGADADADAEPYPEDDDVNEGKL